MKLVYYAHSLLSRGGDKMVLAHAGWLAAHGHDVEICCNVVDTVLDIPEGVSFSRPSLPGQLGTVISALFGRRDADVVLASIIPMACFLFPRSRRKVVYFAQDYDESYYASPLLKGLVRCFYHIGLKIFRIPAISVSLPLADLLRKRFHARVAVAENGVDTRVFYPDPDPELVAAKGNHKAILLLSRSDRRKGFDIAQDVMKRLSPHSGLIEVWTVGEPCADFFPGLVHRDFGYVGEETLRRVMSSADVLMYPTRHEGFGLMPLEAMACGCSVVTTEAVPYGRDGQSMRKTGIEDADAMTSLLAEYLEHPFIFDDLKLHCSSVVNKYDLTECQRQFEHILSEEIGVN
jgi:glycosyltransferase involved in cell wall biosynthesis